MLSGPLGKLLVLIAVVAIVWYGWKYVNRLGQVSAEERRRAPRRKGASLPTEDMTKCRVCGAYVTAAATNCGRPDCPY